METYIALSYWDLAAASVLVFINAGLSVIFRLRVHRSLLIAAIRMVVQLALVGLVLTTLFSVVSPLWTGLAALGMVLFAGHEAAQRQERGLSGWWSYGLGTGSMMMSSVLVTVFALLTALRPNPWYDPRYVPAFAVFQREQLLADGSQWPTAYGQQLPDRGHRQQRTYRSLANPHSPT